MFEEYYEFLCKRLVSWANTVRITPGDRYVLSFEESQQVEDFMSSLKKLDNVASFAIDPRNPGLVGLAVTLENQSNPKLVIVSTNNVTPDYLVSLRNQIGRQTGVWEQTALLFVSNRILDSINSGAKDISRQGGPFNLDELRKNLENEIRNHSALSDKEQVVLQSMVQSFFKGEQTFTLMDFADAYAVIEKGKIEPQDYTKMGYFQDKSLLTYSDEDIDKRLAANHEDYAEISLLRGFGDTQEKIGKLVSGDYLTRELSGNDWQEVDYDRILTGKEKLNRENQVKINYLADNLQKLNPNTQVWDRPQKLTKAGQRNRQIIIFNSTQATDVDLVLPFDQSLDKNGLSAKLDKSTNPKISLTNHRISLHFQHLGQTSVATKIVYKHQNQSSMRFTFNILILPVEEDILSAVRSVYTLNVRANNQFTVRLPSDIGDFELGAGPFGKAIQAQTVADLDGLAVTKWEKLVVKTGELTLLDDKEDRFQLLVSDISVPFSFIDEDEKVVPRNAVYLENYRRQHTFDGHYRGNQILFGEMAFNVYDTQKKFLDWEFNALKTGELYPKYPNLELSEQLIRQYFNLFSALRKRNTVMSLVNWDDEIKGLVQGVLDEIQLEISSTDDRIELTTYVQNIVHIGEFNLNGNIAFAPFSPILLGYQLQVERDVGQEDLSETIQRKLSPIHLVPFLKREAIDYKADYDSNAPRWLIYSKSNLSRFNETSQKIVTERLKDFKKHFSYLFEINPKSFYNVRAVNVKDEKPLLKSVTDYLVYEIGQNRENLEKINPVALYLVNQNRPITSSEISRFYKITNKQTYEEFFHQPLKTIADISSEQVIETIQKKLTVYYGADPQVDYHITFYQFANHLTLSQYSTEQLAMNYSINGLIGGDEYTNVQNSIKNGFGTRGLSNDHCSTVLELAKSWNELLVATARRHGVMTHGQTLTNSIEEMDNREFQEQFNGSKWVTLLNPEVKLDFFNRMDQNIYVIHYTDYTNSANYESITLTKQVHQYEIILSENLPEDIVSRNDSEFLTTIIKSFNVINGEWLLRLVSHRNQKNTVKEKLSILAAYKEMLGILEMPDVTWIPLSLEEILRVSGSFVGESRNDTIFSAKSLGATGKISDDLLFIGLRKYEGKLMVTFLPTEVKVGKNNNPVISKANSQVEKTYQVLKQSIFEAADFKSDFYLDFFMKLFFANVSKQFSNGDMDETTYQQLQREREDVIQGNVQIDNTLTDRYHNKFIFSLKADEVKRSLRILDDCTIVEVPESDAFRFSGVTTQKVMNLVQNQKFGFDSSRMLHSADNNRSMGNEDELLKNGITSAKENAEKLGSTVLPLSVSEMNSTNIIGSEDAELSGSINDEHDSSELSTSQIDSTSQATTEKIQPALSYPTERIVKAEDKQLDAGPRRICLGTIDGSTDKAYWEYDNSKLANRHMLITGKSGQGKTYFIQTMLYEFSRQKIDTLIIDYTDSYLPGQLDDLLEEAVPDIKQHIIMQEKLAINPFKYNEYSIGSFHDKESTEAVVSRVAEVLTFVFGLGIQQKSRLITVMNEGMSASSKYTFSALRDQLLEDKSDLSLYGRLQPLLDNDPFMYSDVDFDWADYFGNSGQINIIQLSRFTSSVQKAMIEFVLWDLFNYSQMNTEKKLVYPVFLDEVQNLNFSKEAPTFKILTEGRKFGWSGVFATQSLSSIKGEVDSIYNTAEQIHFLPPESQTRSLAKTLSSDRNQQRVYEQELSGLQKGQCLVNGPVLTQDNRLIKSVNIVNIDSLDARINS